MSAAVKICGITRLADAELAVALGADAIGFIFHRASPRYIEPGSAGAIARALPAHVLKIGVFVNAAADELERASRAAGLTRIQLHGEETAEACERAPLPVIKALRLAGEADLARAAFGPNVVGFLLDARAPEGVWGGTGAQADWKLCARFDRQGRELWLAGGITPGNCLRALAEVSPSGLDVSSGVEAGKPGIKDEAKLRALLGAVKGGPGERRS
jgi:phosphoribosylanthranilate isomerase